MDARRLSAHSLFLLGQLLRDVVVADGANYVSGVERVVPEVDRGQNGVAPQTGLSGSREDAAMDL